MRGLEKESFKVMGFVRSFENLVGNEELGDPREEVWLPITIPKIRGVRVRQEVIDLYLGILFAPRKYEIPKVQIHRANRCLRLAIQNSLNIRITDDPISFPACFP